MSCCKEKTKDMSNSRRAMAADRMAICKECPWYRSITKQCKKCGCFMPAKTLLKNTKCPLRKWSKIDAVYD